MLMLSGLLACHSILTWPSEDTLGLDLEGMPASNLLLLSHLEHKLASHLSFRLELQISVESAKGHVSGTSWFPMDMAVFRNRPTKR